jgi:hypothetical protein
VKLRITCGEWLRKRPKERLRRNKSKTDKLKSTERDRSPIRKKRSAEEGRSSNLFHRLLSLGSKLKRCLKMSSSW